MNKELAEQWSHMLQRTSRASVLVNSHMRRPTNQRVSISRRNKSVINVMAKRMMKLSMNKEQLEEKIKALPEDDPSLPGLKKELESLSSALALQESAGGKSSVAPLHKVSISSFAESGKTEQSDSGSEAESEFSVRVSFPDGSAADA